MGPNFIYVSHVSLPCLNMCPSSPDLCSATLNILHYVKILLLSQITQSFSRIIEWRSECETWGPAVFSVQCSN